MSSVSYDGSKSQWNFEVLYEFWKTEPFKPKSVRYMTESEIKHDPSNKNRVQIQDKIVPSPDQREKWDKNLWMESLNLSRVGDTSLNSLCTTLEEEISKKTLQGKINTVFAPGIDCGPLNPPYSCVQHQLVGLIAATVKGTQKMTVRYQSSDVEVDAGSNKHVFDFDKSSPNPNLPELLPKIPGCEYEVFPDNLGFCRLKSEEDGRKTLVVLLDHRNPWRQILGEQMEVEKIRPACIICCHYLAPPLVCIPHDVALGQPQIQEVYGNYIHSGDTNYSFGSRDEGSTALGDILLKDYTQRILIPNMTAGYGHMAIGPLSIYVHKDVQSYKQEG
ncbi:hypothetical protein BS50DRAFT_640401 [Corynespora cassiicola Philippines]|uniref:Uncharacterized protein n=1 Tax=Corynespora cassiicola Philippines TaxID=1448308 RepID=A0A2T2N4L0_CORCC|nr:hypothetical protein BS50DRAFT_640401 [Corynespora cassiicola Philippines]